MLDGFTGVFVKPIEGVSKDGVGGFFKGVVKGVTGLVVQPVTGVLDGVSKLTEGVSNNLNIDNEHDVRLDKSRYPRIFYGPQQIYKTYDERDAKIFRILGATKKKYKIFNVMDSIYFKFNWQKSATESCLWLTLEKIFFLININDNFELLWKISLKVIEDVGTDQNSVKLQLNKKKSYINVKNSFLLKR